jgi:hypothetical protein
MTIHCKWKNAEANFPVSENEEIVCKGLPIKSLGLKKNGKRTFMSSLEIFFFYLKAWFASLFI